MLTPFVLASDVALAATGRCDQFDGMITAPGAVCEMKIALATTAFVAVVFVIAMLAS